MKRKQIVLYVLVMLVMLTTSVYATISADLSISINSDSTKLYAGDEFSIDIGLKNIECENGIKSIEGYIDIDENVLEKLTIASIVTGEDGKVHIDDNNVLSLYDADNIASDTGIVFNTDPLSKKGDYRIVINLNNPVSEDTNLVTIKFKVRDDIAPGTYSKVMAYKLFSVFSDNAEEKVELTSHSFKVEISNKNDTNDDTNTGITDDNTANNPGDKDNTDKDNNNNNNNNNDNGNNDNNGNNNNNDNANKDPNNNGETQKPGDNTQNNPTDNGNKQPSNGGTQNPTDDTGSGKVYKVTNDGTYKPSNYTPTATNKNTTPASTSTTGTNKTGVAGTTSKQDSTISATNLPKTGYKVVILPIIIIAIVGLVFYKKYSKYNYHE